MTFDFWHEKYKPINNPFVEGFTEVFETYGEECDFVHDHDVHNIWTVIEGDDDLHIVSGLHLVNRLNYIITENKWKKYTSLKYDF